MGRVTRFPEFQGVHTERSTEWHDFRRSFGSGSGSGPPVDVTENLGPPKVPKVAAIAAIGFSMVFLNIPSTLCFFVATTFRTFQLMKLIVTSGKREGGRYFTNLTPERLFCLRHVFIMCPLHYFQLTSVTILPFLDAYRIIYINIACF